MNSDPDIKATQQAAARYWFVDGLAELFAGGMCLLLAAWFLALETGLISPPLYYILFFLIFGASYGLRRVMLGIKARSTYPRTGYIGYRWGTRGWGLVALGSTLGLLALNAWLILQGPPVVAWPPLIGGLLFAFVFVYNARFFSLPRFYPLAVFSLLAGGLFAFSRLPEMTAVAFLCVLIGLILLAFGVWTRRLYLRQAPPSSE